MTTDPRRGIQDAAGAYRIQQRRLDAARGDLVTAVKAASESGMSEYQIADAAGVTRQTVRVWLGKGRSHG